MEYIEHNGEKIRLINNLGSSLSPDVKFGVTQYGTIVWMRDDQVHCVYVRNHHSNVQSYQQ